MPPKDWRKDNPRKYRLKARFSEEEEQIIRDRAAAAGKSRSAYMRDAMLNAEIDPPKPSKSPLDVDELKAVGDQLNELAKSANSGKDLDPDHLNEVLARFRAVLAPMLDKDAS